MVEVQSLLLKIWNSLLLSDLLSVSFALKKRPFLTFSYSSSLSFSSFIYLIMKQLSRFKITKHIEINRIVCNIWFKGVKNGYVWKLLQKIKELPHLPFPAFTFDFYWFELCIKPNPSRSTLTESKVSVDDEGVRERPFASGFFDPCKYGYV